jgi:hypothetical protein
MKNTTLLYLIIPIIIIIEIIRWRLSFLGQDTLPNIVTDFDRVLGNILLIAFVTYIAGNIVFVLEVFCEDNINNIHNHIKNNVEPYEKTYIIYWIIRLHYFLDKYLNK